MSILKSKTEKEKNNILLEKLCSNLQDRFLIIDLALTVDGGKKDPDQQFEGKMILSKYPAEAELTPAKN